MTHLTAILASTTQLTDRGLSDQPRAIAVAAADELPTKCSRPPAKAGAVGTRRIGQDRPELALERDAFPGRTRLQTAHRVLFDVADHDLGHAVTLP